MLTLIKDLQGKKFIIPAYQRGYRWTVDDKGNGEITDLLQDIFEFSTGTTSNPKQYCIQPLIIKKIEVDGVEKYEVIDGQQRLTTIFLILNNICNFTTKNEELLSSIGVSKTLPPPYELEYVTRTGSASYLKNPTDTDKNSNIDFYHIFKASEQIEKYLASNKIKRDDFANKILSSVGFICFEVPDLDDKKTIETFAKENTGKIPLTSAELIKAILFSKENYTRKTLSSGREEDYNNFTDRVYKEQTQMAMFWDTVEQTLENQEFWGFISNSNNYQTKIDLLFNILANIYNKSADNQFEISQKYFSFFVLANQLNSDLDKEDKLGKIWRKFESVFSYLKSYYDDAENYHILGSAIACGVSVDDIVDIILSNDKDKARKNIFEKVKSTVFGKRDKQKAEEFIKDMEYGDKQVRNVLLLFNTTTILLMLKENPKNTSQRFPFNLYKFSPWNIEHIHAVKDSLSERVDENEKYCDSIIYYLEKNKSASNEDETVQAIGEINKNKSNKKGASQNAWWKPCKEKYAELLGAKDNDNYIRNLTLLDEGTNKSYSNSPFSVKKNIIHSCVEKGVFVPICTQNIFLKLYSGGTTDLFRWADEDRENYVNKLAKTITDYWFI